MDISSYMESAQGLLAKKIRFINLSSVKRKNSLTREQKLPSASLHLFSSFFLPQVFSGFLAMVASCTPGEVLLAKEIQSISKSSSVIGQMENGTAITAITEQKLKKRKGN